MTTGPRKEYHVPFSPYETRWSASDILPETVQVEIIEGPDGTTFDKMVALLGGIDGIVVDPIGQRHSVSLQRWVNANHSKVRLGVSVTYQIREEKRHLPAEDISK